MRRRRFLKTLATIPALACLSLGLTVSALGQVRARIKPNDPEWPSEASWQQLGRGVGGRLTRVTWPLARCVDAPGSAECGQIFEKLKNPYYLGNEVGLTQTLGWTDGWRSRPSEYAVRAETTEDVVAAVNFARGNDLRLVVKGGGHSYQGTSNAPDSLLIWTRPMNAVTLHDAFVDLPIGRALGDQKQQL